MKFIVLHNPWNGLYEGYIRVNFSNELIASTKGFETNSWKAVIIKLWSILKSITEDKKYSFKMRVAFRANLELFDEEYRYKHRFLRKCIETFNSSPPKGNFVSFEINGII